MNIVKISLERLCNTSTLSNIFERNLAVESIWKDYSKYVVENYSQTNIKIFTLLLYFLEGFLRNGLRRTFKSKLSDYFISRNSLQLHIGQIYILNSTNLSQLVKNFSLNEILTNQLINPLLFIRVGNYYLDRSVLTNYVEDLSTLLENQTTFVSQLNQNLMSLEVLLLKLHVSLTNYYISITFSS